MPSQRGHPHKVQMTAGLILAAALFGQPAEAAPTAALPANSSAARCSARAPDADSSQIVICAPKPDGYRIDPDVLEAKREKREALAGRPKPPENLKDHSCKVVGPAPCMDAPMVNLLAAAATAAEMAARLSKGQEIGSMFVTDPQPTEYQLYVEAKKRREAKEAEEEAAKAAKNTASTNAP